MKVSGGFRSEKGANAFAKVGSVIGSAVKQGKALLDTVSKLFRKPHSNSLATE
jgi:hypothetical protein